MELSAGACNTSSLWRYEEYISHSVPNPNLRNFPFLLLAISETCAHMCVIILHLFRALLHQTSCLLFHQSRCRFSVDFLDNSRNRAKGTNVIGRLQGT